MTRGELVTELLALARRAEDLAASLEASAAHHRPEYERCLRVPPPEVSTPLHHRVLELFSHVVENDKEAVRLRQETIALREAAEIIEEDASTPMAGKDRP